MTKEDYMSVALEEAKKGMGFTNPNPMVGAVIVKDGKIISKDHHHRYGEFLLLFRQQEDLDRPNPYILFLFRCRLSPEYREAFCRGGSMAQE